MGKFDSSVIFIIARQKKRVKSKVWDFLSNNPATSQPPKKLSQNVLLKTRLGSGQRPRKIRVRSAASFIITVLNVARETQAFPGKILKKTCVSAFLS